MDSKSGSKQTAPEHTLGCDSEKQRPDAALAAGAILGLANKTVTRRSKQLASVGKLLCLKHGNDLGATSRERTGWLYL
jgi:hypothetical protein